MDVVKKILGKKRTIRKEFNIYNKKHAVIECLKCHKREHIVGFDRSILTGTCWKDCKQPYHGAKIISM